MKNKKAGVSTIILDNAIYLILVGLLIVGTMVFISMQKNGAAVWQDYYAKEIVKIINLGENEDEFVLNVHDASEIAQDNGIDFRKESFVFDNENNEVCVKLGKGRATCYSYFNNLDVVGSRFELGVPGNVLHFKLGRVV